MYEYNSKVCCPTNRPISLCPYMIAREAPPGCHFPHTIYRRTQSRSPLPLLPLRRQLLLQLGADGQIADLSLVAPCCPRRRTVLFGQRAENPHGNARVHLHASPALSALLVDATVAESQFAVFAAGLAALGTYLAEREGFGESREAFWCCRIVVVRKWIVATSKGRHADGRCPGRCADRFWRGSVGGR